MNIKNVCVSNRSLSILTLVYAEISIIVLPLTALNCIQNGTSHISVSPSTMVVCQI